MSRGALRPATIDEVVRDPIGRYVAGRSYLIWVDSPTLAGAMYVGRPEEREFPDLLRLAGLPAHPALAPGLDVVIDCGELQPLDATAFVTLAHYLGEVSALAARIGSVSIVKPVGLAGAITAGLFVDSIRERFHSALFATTSEAFAWLDRDDATAARERVGRIAEAMHGTPPVLRALRDHVTSDLIGANLCNTARALGLSERSLSRRLCELGTSFRGELLDARRRASEVLLVETDLKLDAVARRVGFRSRAHFSAYFHRATDETPSGFRARRRR